MAILAQHRSLQTSMLSFNIIKNNEGDTTHDLSSTEFIGKGYDIQSHDKTCYFKRGEKDLPQHDDLHGTGPTSLIVNSECSCATHPGTAHPSTSITVNTSSLRSVKHDRIQRFPGVDTRRSNSEHTNEGNPSACSHWWMSESGKGGPVHPRNKGDELLGNICDASHLTSEAKDEDDLDKPYLILKTAETVINDHTEIEENHVGKQKTQGDDHTCTEDMASTFYKEDDVYLDGDLICGKGKCFPPPISVLVNQKHPSLPSHAARTVWRSVKRDGRFLLQLVQAQPREFFQAMRENGRLILQLVRPQQEKDDDNFDDVEADVGGA